MSNPRPRLTYCLISLLALVLSRISLADTHTAIDMRPCDDTKPVIMLVAGRTLDASRMRDYAIALQRSDLYPNARGYYPEQSAACTIGFWRASPI